LTIIIIFSISSIFAAGIPVYINSSVANPENIHVMTENAAQNSSVKQYILSSLTKDGKTGNYIVPNTDNSAGRIYISFNNPLPSTAIIDPSNPNVQSIRYDLVELTNTGGPNDSANLSSVNQLGIPMKLETYKSGKLVQSVGYKDSFKTIIDAAYKINQNSFIGSTGRDFIRVISPDNSSSDKHASSWADKSNYSITAPIQEFYPMQIKEVSHCGYNKDLFDFLLFEYHYLSYRTTVGESMKYLIFDKDERPLGCVLFGSAAWKTADRDKYIGWTAEIREKKLNYLTNNTRFLILPWVKVPNLASCILGMVLRRLNKDWLYRYGHEIYLVETFVEQSRFRRTCYQAANWQRIGETVGRSRQDRYSNMKVPVKDIYVYPLLKNYKKLLCQ